MQDLDLLLTSIPKMNPYDRSLVERAYHKARLKHDGIKRLSGEPYFTHCVAVAKILADMKLDAEAIAAALMHDLIEDTDVTRSEIAVEFNETIASLVESVTKLEKLPIPIADNPSDIRKRDVDRENEYLRKMFMAMGDDIRVVLIKLADRLHNMQTLDSMPPEKQISKSRETLELYAPLANRLGIWEIKWRLEDLAFRYLEKDSYKAIARCLDERRAERDQYIEQVIQKVQQALNQHGLSNVNIKGRSKHIYSIYSKMKRKHIPFEEVYDVQALRIIVDTLPQCYLALGIIHNMWRPVPGEFDDYIASPKDNFYQSLHTAVIDDSGRHLEVQIRTWDMHEHAEYGIAAHWRYKEGAGRDDAFDNRVAFIRRLLEFGQEDDNQDSTNFMEALRTEVFEDRVYVFTPQGDIVDLPKGATPIDFAYHIHTEVGNRCRGAKVNGKLVTLSYELKNGDKVKIETNKYGGPKLDWLNSGTGFVKTQRARSKIRYWFRKQNRDKNLAEGRNVVVHELKRLGLSDTYTFESVAALFDFADTQDFFVAVGSGNVDGAHIAARLLDSEKTTNSDEGNSERQANAHRKPDETPLEYTGSIQVEDSSGYPVNMAKCCNPVVGDPIIGYITRGRGVSVHRADCVNILALNEYHRFVTVSWGHVNRLNTVYVPIEIIAFDRDGLLRDISTAIAKERINLTDVKVSLQQDIATFNLMMQLQDLKQLPRVLGLIEGISSVVDARRITM